MSNGYGKSAPAPVTRDESIQLIVQACLDAGITNEKQIAYVLATAEHESQNFTALEENHGRKQAVARGYEGGEDYFGRGYAHLTHDYNYRKMGDEVGISNLEQQPHLAAEPQHAANILAVGMRDGIYTSRKLERYINDDQTDYVGARAVVNGSDKAQAIADLARDWEAQVPGLVSRVQRDGVNVAAAAAPAPSADLRQGMADENVFHMQQYLVALNATANDGRAITADGDFGARSHQAVVRYQQQAGIAPADGVVDEALLQQMRVEVLQANPDFEFKSFTALHGPLNDSVLDRGERGDPVIELKAQLVGLGHMAPLPAQGRNTYGQSTVDAVRAFQIEAGITPSNGVADERTRDAINAAAVAAGLPETIEALARRAQQQAEQDEQQPQPAAPAGQQDDAQHKAGLPTQRADYQTLFPQVLKQLHAAEQERGIAAGPHSLNLAGVITVASLREGVQPHRVELNADGSMARAVQHGPGGDDALFNRTTSAIATAQAVSVPEQRSAQTAEHLGAATPLLDAAREHSQQPQARAALQMG